VRRYHLWLLAFMAGVVVVAVGGTAWVVTTLEKVSAEASVINQAGRQRMLCERIVRSSLLLASSLRPEGDDLIGRELERDLEAWQASHHALRASAGATPIPDEIEAQISSLLEAIEPHQQRVVRAAQAIASSVTAGPSRSSVEGEVRELLAGEQRFLVGMEAVVAAYEGHARAYAGRIGWMSYGALAIGLVLIAVALFASRAALREVTERHKAQASLARRAREAGILHSVTSMAVAADSLGDALRHCIRIVCEATGWPVAHVYLPDPAGGPELVPSSIWYPQDPQGFQTFRTITERSRFAPGVGLPGRILTSRKPAWIRNVQEDANFPRARQARDIGVRGAFGFPVQVGGEVVAVLEFFAPEEVDADQALLALAESVGTQLGQVVARQHAAEAVRENEVRLRATFDTVLDALIVIDERGVIQAVNPATLKIFGYDPAELVGRNVTHLMPEPYRSEHDGYLRRYFETGEPRILGSSREVTALRKDGTTFPADLSVNEMRLGRRRQFVGMLRDITARKRVQELKDDFISTVSHELRTPLTSIYGSLGLVSEGAAGDLSEDGRRLIDIAYRNTQRLTRLINDILDLEKIESGKLELELRPLPLASCLAEALEANRPFSETCGVRCTLREPVPDVAILADGDRVQQVLTNLLSNAAKFSPAGEEIVLEAAVAEGRARISVRDRGPGIPDEFRDQLFERFTQAGTVSTRRGGGTGLGLSICKAIVDELNGAISFESEVGRGTTFFVELPLAGSPSETEPAPRPGRRVLVCEDDPDTARVLSGVLGWHGYIVDVAGTAAAAEACLQEQRYDAVTLDLGLPDRNGIELLRDLRASAGTASLPVVVVSASADVERGRLDGDALEIVDWISKPLDEKRLVGALDLAFRRPRPSRPRILHIEDDPDLGRIVRGLVGDRADLVEAATLAAARERLRSERFDLVIVDIGLPDGSGLEAVRQLDRRTPVIVFAGQETDGEPPQALAASLVKSEVSPEQLIETVLFLLDKAQPAQAEDVG
jgi:PAS domain S-box-containing protein